MPVAWDAGTACWQIQKVLSGQGPLNAAFRLHHRRDRAPSEVRGRPSTLLLQLLTRLSHTFTRRGAGPLRPSRKPSLRLRVASEAALGWHDLGSCVGQGLGPPASCSGAGRSSRCQQECLGTRGPCVTTQWAPQVHLSPTGFGHFLMGTDEDIRGSKQGAGLEEASESSEGCRGPEHAHVSEGALPGAKQRRRSSPHPWGQCLF